MPPWPPQPLGRGGEWSSWHSKLLEEWDSQWLPESWPFPIRWAQHPGPLVLCSVPAAAAFIFGGCHRSLKEVPSAWLRAGPGLPAGKECRSELCSRVQRGEVTFPEPHSFGIGADSGLRLPVAAAPSTALLLSPSNVVLVESRGSSGPE